MTGEDTIDKCLPQNKNRPVFSFILQKPYLQDIWTVSFSIPHPLVCHIRIILFKMKLYIEICQVNKYIFCGRHDEFIEFNCTESFQVINPMNCKSCDLLQIHTSGESFHTI